MNVLVIDDDSRFRQTIVDEIIDHGYSALGFSSYKDYSESQSSVQKNYTHALVDLRLIDENGIEVVQKLRSQSVDMRIVMFTGYGSIATAVSAVKSGADDYLSKPVDIDLLLATLKGVELAEKDPIEHHEMTLARYEREYIELILEKCEGNISKAARVLGLHRQSLQRMLKKYPVKE
jgi:two-component system response regulator RegA